jgi:murein DD-endopeptidase MepM/ murein hydrolase activator NlpD
MALVSALPVLFTGAFVAAAAVLVTAAPAPTGSVAQRPASGTVAGGADPRSPAAVPAGGGSGPAGVLPGPAGAASGPGAAGLRSGFGWPLPGTPTVVRGFAPGPHPWSPGHRGVDLVGGDAVLAAGAGTVAFAGMIAGRGVVVVRHDGNLRTTYEPVTAQVGVGQAVTRGDRIGALQPGVAHCAASSCLHWGALTGSTYLDPLRLLADAHRPPVLLPLGAGARSGPVPGEVS